MIFAQRVYVCVSVLYDGETLIRVTSLLVTKGAWEEVALDRGRARRVAAISCLYTQHRQGWLDAGRLTPRVWIQRHQRAPHPTLSNCILSLSKSTRKA
jgi:hypothetical protein